MNILDIHTHTLPAEPGSALVCIETGPIPAVQGHWYSAGLHPWHVTGNDEALFSDLERLLANAQVLAIGECGFDALKGPSHDLQEQAFVRQCQLSERSGKPMILHVVRDFDSVIRLHRQLKPGQPWLIHGFRGGPEQMRQLHANGLSVSFGPKYNPLSLAGVQPDRLFLETDGVGDIGDIIREAARLRSQSVESIVQTIAANTLNFLRRSF